jgi:beta-glucosidase
MAVLLDRPAILTNVKPLVSAMFGDYGISDAALLDVIAGKAQPEGKLPFELPSSMEAVRNQLSDLPYDSKDPLYVFGFGLHY